MGEGGSRKGHRESLAAMPDRLKEPAPNDSSDEEWNPGETTRARRRTVAAVNLVDASKYGRVRTREQVKSSQRKVKWMKFGTDPDTAEVVRQRLRKGRRTCASACFGCRQSRR
jgi:hypothetical protein